VLCWYDTIELSYVINAMCVYVCVRYRYHGRLIRDPKLIAKRYLRGWFLIDFPTRCVVLLLLINFQIIVCVCVWLCVCLVVCVCLFVCVCVFTVFADWTVVTMDCVCVCLCVFVCVCVFVCDVWLINLLGLCLLAIIIIINLSPSLSLLSVSLSLCLSVSVCLSVCLSLSLSQYSNRSYYPRCFWSAELRIR